MNLRNDNRFRQACKELANDSRFSAVVAALEQEATQATNRLLSCDPKDVLDARACLRTLNTILQAVADATKKS